MAWSMGLSPGSKILQQGPGHAACLGSNQLPALLLHLWGGALGNRWWGSPARLPIADRKCRPTYRTLELNIKITVSPIFGCQGRRRVREFGMIMYTLLYSKWIINKDLSYST